MKQNKKVKVFLSVPMRGRHWSEVAKTFKVLTDYAEALYGIGEVEIVSAFVKDKPTTDVKENLTELWYLGESFKQLSKADMFIGVTDTSSHGFYGCVLEEEAAKYYGIDWYLMKMEEACPDIIKEEFYKE